MKIEGGSGNTWLRIGASATILVAGVTFIILKQNKKINQDEKTYFIIVIQEGHNN